MDAYVSDFHAIFDANRKVHPAIRLAEYEKYVEEAKKSAWFKWFSEISCSSPQSCAHMKVYYDFICNYNVVISHISLGSIINTFSNFPDYVKNLMYYEEQNVRIGCYLPILVTINKANNNISGIHGIDIPAVIYEDGTSVYINDFAFSRDPELGPAIQTPCFRIFAKYGFMINGPGNRAAVSFSNGTKIFVDPEEKLLDVPDISNMFEGTDRYKCIENTSYSSVVTIQLPVPKNIDDFCIRSLSSNGDIAFCVPVSECPETKDEYVYSACQSATYTAGIIAFVCSAYIYFMST